MILLLQAALAAQCVSNPVGATCEIGPQDSIQTVLQGFGGGDVVELVLEPGYYLDPVEIVSIGKVIIRSNGASDAVTFLGAPGLGWPVGQAALFQVQDAVVVFQHLTFSVESVGAVAATHSEVELNDVVVTASGSGWGVELEGGMLTVEGSLFVGGLRHAGPHIYGQDSLLTVRHTDLQGGRATGYGGSITSLGTGILLVEDASFESNEAAQGGALAVKDEVRAVVRRTRFENNRSARGGALWTGPGSTDLLVERVDFVTNAASERGGAVFSDSRSLVVRETTFCKNSTLGSGGGAYLQSNHPHREVLVENSRFLDNFATYEGGALRGHGGVRVNHSNLLGNAAGREGAALAGMHSVLWNSLVAYSHESIAVTENNEFSTMVWWNNEIKNVEGFESYPQQDPRLRGYTPGQPCGLRNDFHRITSPMTRLGLETADEDRLSERLRELSFCEPSGCFDSDGPDIGAYGRGGFAEIAWIDEDGDGWPALYDCQDEEPLIHPGVDVDVAYDGTDADCRGDDDYDKDGDGYRGGSLFQDEDCDDDDVDTHPGAIDNNPDKDLDCDGRIEEDAPEFLPADGCGDLVGGRSGSGRALLLLVPGWGFRRRRRSGAEERQDRNTRPEESSGRSG